ncbi:hypothetical protein K7G98_24875, partial [Saccharothrix sp. MB29]|nr:hypothetical protein [Saccharothrix sp. MB29]
MVAEQLGREVDVVIEKDKDTVGLIHSSMFTEAMQAEVYIADLTGANANVYLELGVRWALRDHMTVPVCQNVAHDVKFNVAAIRVIPYGKNPGELKGPYGRSARRSPRACNSSSSTVQCAATSIRFRLPGRAGHAQRAARRTAEARGDGRSTRPSTPVHQHRTDLLRRLIESANRADAYSELVPRSSKLDRTSRPRKLSARPPNSTRRTPADGVRSVSHSRQ